MAKFALEDFEALLNKGEEMMTAQYYEIQSLQALNVELLAALKWAERALAPFSTEPAEKSGITMIRNAIKKAESK